MRELLKGFMDIWRTDYLFKTVFSSAFSTLASFFFTLYNGVLGVLYGSLWNGSVCVYYLLLGGIRAVIVWQQRGLSAARDGDEELRQRRVYVYTHLALILMNLSLIVPITLMVKGEHVYGFGLVAAIAIAAYTTYRITASIIHFRKSRRFENLLVAELRTINLVDSLVAVLTLQNVLISATGGMSAEMQMLTAWTSGGILALIVIITVHSFRKLCVRRDVAEPLSAEAELSETANE